MTNPRTDQTEWDEHYERRELARLLPPPPHLEPSLSQLADRRDFLLTEFARPRPLSGLTTRWRGLVLVTAVATAAAITAMTLAPDSASTEEAPPATAASVELLDRIARVAYTQPQPSAQDSQYTYIRTVGHTTALAESADGSMQRSTTTTNTERWTAVNGARPGLQRGDGGDQQLPAPDPVSLNAPSYRMLAGLPSEPEALTKLIYADAGYNHGAGSASTTGSDQEAFVTIGDLLCNAVAPPAVSAALYRAASRIPGVTTVDDAVDAVGRHGVAVARVHDGTRFEWIFDQRTMRLLGKRAVLVKDGPWGRAGDEVNSVALVAQGIVGAPGEGVAIATAESSQ
ncbi:CU044_5270 family protein [Kitasatospora purpeofusca]|uniref:CU044_5270 family protein n=1 Tax=Kitasatospora purpeofusca TaxID=67352 RepID=UPI00386CEDE7|nr:CU044_5270 family protein [Kitasatospora purpeofusca]